jgi:hypothetical protein
MLNFPAFRIGIIGPEAVYRFGTPQRLFEICRIREEGQWRGVGGLTRRKLSIYL